MQKWEGLDRRKFPRINYPCLIVVRNTEDKTDVFLTHTENVGIGGVCVILKKNLKMFSPVEIELDLLDFESHIKCNGKIVWNVQRKGEAERKPLFYDIGIEFEDLSVEELKRLEDVIKKMNSGKKG